MKIIIAGASGLIGSALAPAFAAAGHEVHRLVRRPASRPEEIPWHPAEGELDPAHLAGAEVIVNLAGENIAAGRWTAARRERIRRSRIDSTKTLVSAITRAPTAIAALLSASAVGFYGDRGDEVLTESSLAGRGFLPEVCLAWETHADAAARAGVRTVRLRFGMVLAGDGGALCRMLPLFRAGLGGRLGSGRQWMSWVSIQDVVGAIVHCAESAACTGPVNVTAPEPVRNAEFAATLARVVRRPAVLPAPAWGLRAAFGSMADEALLASERAVPERLLGTGYAFRQPTLEGALKAVLER
jgi:uncharacterized protein